MTSRRRNGAAAEGRLICGDLDSSSIGRGPEHVAEVNAVHGQKHCRHESLGTVAVPKCSIGWFRCV